MCVYLSAIDLTSSTGMTRIKRPPGAMVNDNIVFGMEAMTRMECFKVTWIRTGRLPQVLSWKTHLLLFLLLLLLFFLFIIFFFCIFFTLWSIGVSFLFAGPHSKPFRQSCFGSFLPFSKFVLPCCFQSFRPENFSSTFIELFPVSISSCVSPALILGEHVDWRGVSSSEGFRVKTLLDGLVPELKFLPFCQFFELVVLVLMPLLIIIFVCL